MKTILAIIVLIFIVIFIFPYKNLAQTPIKGKNTSITNTTDININTNSTQDTLIKTINDIVLIDSLIDLKKQENKTEKELIVIKAELQKQEIKNLKKEFKKSVDKNYKLEKEIVVLKNELESITDSINNIKPITFRIDSICIKESNFLGIGRKCKEWEKIKIYE